MDDPSYHCFCPFQNANIATLDESTLYVASPGAEPSPLSGLLTIRHHRTLLSYQESEESDIRELEHDAVRKRYSLENTARALREQEEIQWRHENQYYDQGQDTYMTLC